MNRKVGFIVAVAILVVGLFIGKVMSNQSESVQRRMPKKETANYMFHDVTNKNETFNLELTGPMYSLNSLTLFSEVTGVATFGKKEFRPGMEFKKGTVLLKIDDREYKNNLYAQKSMLMNRLTLLIPDLKLDFPKSAEKWQKYLENFEIENPLPPLPTAKNNKEKYYIASRNIYNQYYTIKSMETRLSKYTITAPYDGVVTEAMIKPGTLVRASQQVGTLKNTQTYEMTAFAGIKEARMLTVGMPVTLTSNDIAGEFDGKISRINKTIDRVSQKIKVYIIAESDDLLDGLYMHAKIKMKTNQSVARIPSEAVFNTGQVWIREAGKFRAKNINVIHRTEGYVLAEELDDNIQVLVNPDKTIYDGKAIKNSNMGMK